MTAAVDLPVPAMLPATDPTSEAAGVALDIAARLADPAVLADAITASRRQTEFPNLVWRPASLASGHPGVALLCAVLAACRPDDGWDRVGHTHLHEAVTALARAHRADISLYSGLAGIGVAADLLADGRGDRYRRLLDGVDAALVPPVRVSAQRLRAAHGCAAGDINVVSGLSGVGVYLLRRRRHEAVKRALDEVLTCLAGLLSDAGEPRRWHTPAALSGESLRESYPGGHHNCGLAHGVPGPLALLSIATREGAEVADGREAIEAAAAWLARHAVEDEWGPNWPNAVPLNPANQPAAPPSSRASWCYGGPGVARALWLAGEALDADEYRALALAAIRAALARPPEVQALASPTFCHGTAGLLQITRQFAADTGQLDLITAARDLTASVLAAYQPDSRLSYRHLETPGVLVDHPGLLDGAAGVALTLLAAGGHTQTQWDRVFLLS